MATSSPKNAVSKVRIALLGSIPKGDEIRKNWTDWKAAYRAVLSQAIPDALFLDGDGLSDSAGPELVVGHDLWIVARADIIIVDATRKIGAGTAQEMVLAKRFGKPVVSVIPRDSHHRKSNVVFHGATVTDWIHPFLALSSDYVAETVEAAAEWIGRYRANPARVQIKDMTVYDRAIAAFERELPDIRADYLQSGW